MTIERAIEILEDILRNVKPGDPPDEHAAIKLGIEALKLVAHLNVLWGKYFNFTLPGETKDDIDKQGEVSHE